MLTILTLLVSVSSFASDHGAPAGMGGWEALSALQTGNMRFYEGHSRHPNLDISRREQVAGGQHPHTIVVSCSDSRVPPEEIFDQGLGDMFTVRNAGNVMSVESIASIEYAIEHLGARLLLVMGHESCGAVGAAVGSVPGQSNGSHSLDVLVSQIRGHLSTEAVSAAAGDKTFRRGVKENVSASLADLVRQSAIVRNAVASKGLVLGQAIYSLKSGRVEFWDVGKSGIVPMVSEQKVQLREPVVKEEVITEPIAAVKPKAKAKPKAKTAKPAAKDPVITPPSAHSEHAAPAAAPAHDAHHH